LIHFYKRDKMLVMLLLAVAGGCGVAADQLQPSRSNPAASGERLDPEANYRAALNQFAAREPREERGWIDSIMSFATSGLGFSDSDDEVQEVEDKRPTFYTSDPSRPVSSYPEADRRASSGHSRPVNSYPEADRRSGGSGRPVKISAKQRKNYSPAVRPAQEMYVGGGLGRLIGGILPNSYYSRPKYRFPYYDHNGKGYLMYGYGGKELYEYSVFKPLEGYF